MIGLFKFAQFLNPHSVSHSNISAHTHSAPHNQSSVLFLPASAGFSLEKFTHNQEFGSFLILQFDCTISILHLHLSCTALTRHQKFIALLLLLFLCLCTVLCSAETNIISFADYMKYKLDRRQYFNATIQLFSCNRFLKKKKTNNNFDIFQSQVSCI